MSLGSDVVCVILEDIVICSDDDDDIDDSVNGCVSQLASSVPSKQSGIPLHLLEHCPLSQR